MHEQTGNEYEDEHAECEGIHMLCVDLICINMMMHRRYNAIVDFFVSVFISD